MSAIYDEDDSNDNSPDESDAKKPVRRWSNNPIRDAALRLLNSPAPPREDPDDIETDPPPAIDPQQVGDIPKIGSLEEGVDLFKALNRNIELQEGLGELISRPEARVSEESKRRQALRAHQDQRHSVRLSGGWQPAVLLLPWGDPSAES
ncbi:MAG TPA: hypothetical protein VNX88_00035 [Terriglobales bacterium]|nr:hypothetical protein [Terriglobales bacterium]